MDVHTRGYLLLQSLRKLVFMRRIMMAWGSMLLLLLVVMPGPGALAAGETREQLERELKQIERQIAGFEREIATTESQKKTLANKITVLKKEQEKITLQIKAINLQIRELGTEMNTTGTSIRKTEQQLDVSRERAGAILRAIAEEDSRPIMFTLAGEQGLSAYFGRIDDLKMLTRGLAGVIGAMKTAKALLEGHYTDLEMQRGKKKNLLAVQVLQQQDRQVKTVEQNRLLDETKGKEQQYQAMLANSKKRAVEIRSRIYELLGVGTQITFGEATVIAAWASGKTGVRAALILAVLTQESNLGKNIGTCNRLGDPPTKSWRAVMKPGRDQAPFLTITQKLGLNPDTTPVSCPMRDEDGSPIGWGGAMGPAQFIPSTWVLYENLITRATGKASANPWDIRDAFIASALLLKDNGATDGSNNAEWKAAMRYFSGSTNPAFSFYGNSVLALAAKYEQDLKDLAE